MIVTYRPTPGAKGGIHWTKYGRYESLCRNCTEGTMFLPNKNGDYHCNRCGSQGPITFEPVGEWKFVNEK